MNSELRIVNSQIIFGYARNINIRKRVFDFEDKLKMSFKTPFNVISIPDEIDPNIPRFESTSKHGFSKLQVSQHRVNFSTGFNEAYTKDKVAKYLKEKKDLLTGLVKDEVSEFVAYVIELHCFPPKASINKMLKENTGANVIDDSLRDFSLSYSRVFKDSYFINVKCSKIRLDEITLDSKKREKTIKVHEGISVIVDINSKPSFTSLGKFDENLYKDIDDLVFDIINKKSLEDFLQGNI
jgi:hypothetical protein